MLTFHRQKEKKNQQPMDYFIDKFILQNDSIICILFYKTNLANELNQQTRA